MKKLGPILKRYTNIIPLCFIFTLICTLFFYRQWPEKYLLIVACSTISVLIFFAYVVLIILHLEKKKAASYCENNVYFTHAKRYWRSAEKETCPKNAMQSLNAMLTNLNAAEKTIADLNLNIEKVKCVFVKNCKGVSPVKADETFINWMKDNKKEFGINVNTSSIP